MASTSKLFSPVQIGPLRLSNRVIMAPLTRVRADANNVPLPIMEEHYLQRSCEPGTLLITDATYIHQRAGSNPHVPGIWSDEHVAAWRKVVDAVHSAGGVIFMQLWALGRADNPENKAKRGTGDILSASDIPIGPDRATPRAMTEEEIQDFIGYYATAAKNAVHRAGFDGVEIHGANGYLVDQFLQDVSNKRTDKWGGSIENRSRFALEVIKAIANEIGAERTSIRLSPWSTFQNMRMKDPVPQFSHIIEQLKQFNLAYIHLVEARISGSMDVVAGEKCDSFIELWGKTSPILLAGGFTPESAKRAIDQEYKDYNMAIVFGRYFISNPDIVYRMKYGIELTPYNRATFYTPEKPEGYIDYPFSDQFRDERGTVAA